MLLVILLVVPAILLAILHVMLAVVMTILAILAAILLAILEGHYRTTRPNYPFLGDELENTAKNQAVGTPNSISHFP
jgi:uncharacterized membrane protein